jgi:hypothetical protein
VRTAVALFVCLAASGGASVLAGPLGSGFIGGNVRAAGFPDPLDQNGGNFVSLKNGSGGGSTGGGFAGFSTSFIGIDDTEVGSAISITGAALHFVFDGYTAAYTAEPLVLALTKPTRFSISDISSTDLGPLRMVTFEPGTGSITESTRSTGTLSAGTYSIRYGVGEGVVNQFGPTELTEWFGEYELLFVTGSNLNWRLELTPVLPEYTVGNFAPESLYFVQGQSFTPSVFGNVWMPPNPSSTPRVVRLTRFAIAYDLNFSTPFDSLYIFDVPPTPADAASGNGSRATGTHIGGGVYSFSNTVLDYNTKYYAVLPGPAVIFDGPGDPYPGGVDMFIREDFDPVVIGEGGGFFDIGFDATFEYVTDCPADFNTDGLVEDADFVLFSAGYSTLECLDPAMAPGCPANLNADLMVDDDDFVLFAAAYDALICP